MSTEGDDNLTCAVCTSDDENILVSDRATEWQIRLTLLFALPQDKSQFRRLNTINVDETRPHIAEHIGLAHELVDAHDAGHLLLPSKYFCDNWPRRFTRRAVRVFLNYGDCGPAILREFRDAGVYAFISTIRNRANQSRYNNLVDALIASLVMGLSPIQSVHSLGDSTFLAWLNTYRTSCGRRWNEKLWNSDRDFAFRALREVVSAYAKIVKNNSVLSHARHRRYSSASELRFRADRREDLPIHLSKWSSLCDLWLKSGPISQSEWQQVVMYLFRWLAKHFSSEQTLEPADFLKCNNRPVCFSKFLWDNVTNTSYQDAPPAVLIDYHALGRRLSLFVADELALDIGDTPLFHLITEKEVQKAKNSRGRLPKRYQAQSRALPQKFFSVALDILSEGEQGWPGTCKICYESIVDDSGVATDIYCPVLPTYFYTLFTIPLRGAQVRRLDSGEGDVRRFLPQERRWVANDGPHAGYWLRKYGRTDECGYAQEFRDDSGETVTGFRINTNKTGDPYGIPWENVELHIALHNLRLWQEMYNPVSGPIGPESYLDEDRRSESIMMDELPELFSLFRLTPSARTSAPAEPPSRKKCDTFLVHFLAEIEARENSQLPSNLHVTLVDRDPKSGRPLKARYTTHGLRVTGITYLFLRKIPPQIISKLIVGHKSVLMTLYYYLLNPSYVNNLLNDLAGRDDAQQASVWLEDFKSADLETAHRRAVSLDGSGVAAAIAMPQSDKALWSDVGCGVCPWSGTRCSDGGERLRRSVLADGTDKSVYAPVKGGRTCVLCRHFVTGPAWRIPLWLYGNSLLRQLGCKSERITSLQLELDGAIRARSELRQKGCPSDARLQKEIEELEIALNSLSDERHTIANAIFNVQWYLEAIEQVEMAEAGVGQKAALISTDHNPVFHESIFAFVDGGDFFSSALLSAAGRIYPIVFNQEAVSACDRYVDSIIYRSGGEPLSMSSLPPDVIRKGLDAAADLLLRSLEHQELSALSEGRLRLQDLNLVEAISCAVSASIGSPYTLGQADVRGETCAQLS